MEGLETENVAADHTPDLISLMQHEIDHGCHGQVTKRLCLELALYQLDGSRADGLENEAEDDDRIVRMPDYCQMAIRAPDGDIFCFTEIPDEIRWWFDQLEASFQRPA